MNMSMNVHPAWDVEKMKQRQWERVRVELYGEDSGRAINLRFEDGADVTGLNVCIHYGSGSLEQLLELLRNAVARAYVELHAGREDADEEEDNDAQKGV